MLSRRLKSICNKSFYKHLSTLTKTELNSNSELSSGLESHEKTDPLKHPDYFEVFNLFTVKDLFDAKVHYGHKMSSLNDKMKPFIFGSRLQHIIFDLDKTAVHLREALNFAAHMAFRDGIILFISKNPQITLLVEDTAKECKEFAVTRRWMMGTFRNAVKMFGTEVRLPDLCILLNTLQENGQLYQPVLDAAVMGIPTIGIVDSNCDPNLITYPVPGNDDSISSITLYCNLFKQAILRGKNKRKELENENKKELENENKKELGNENKKTSSPVT